MHKLLPFALGSLLAAPVVAADLNLKIEVPRLTVAEYHRPYVAVWIERPDQSLAGNLAVWYDLKKRDNEGSKWLKDMRQWWRRSGRDLQMPVDGVSGATKVVGEHSLSFSGDKGVLAKLPAGDYQLLVEAAREGGGREVVKVPFQWSGKADQQIKVQGTNELGLITLNIKS
ncbi:DUF2271 domain-containing protein [Undibacterium parvum]|uniref:DUF2271 domain-containing protein n=1 Tax=Undibacterium parvum TaxID=401471 RepID=A0A3S9HI78_9BURK|nr:DUF2271 domain-containing protein [Undibacterium parvum]AZP11813.1 DUF2271 domain-containing protein [Undibacterium parvum]